MSDDVNVSGTPATGDTGAPAASAPASTPAAPQSPAASAQATPQAPASTSAPDGFIPRYRYNEASQRAEQAQAAVKQYETQMAQVKQELERYRSQVQALVGVTPQQNTEAEAIKSQFFQLFPWAKKLEERFGDFESLVDQTNDLKAQSDHYWTSYGKQTMDRLFSLADSSLGSPLTEEGKRQLHNSFVGFVQSSPELTARYANDPSIVEDFWKGFTSSFVDPARRASSANVQQRVGAVARLPQDSPSGAPQTTPAPKLNGLDERALAAWAEFKAKTGRTGNE
jgi:hypothetical protein